jgi:hypothetical protein
MVEYESNYLVSNTKYYVSNSVTIKYSSAKSCGRGCNPCVGCKFN